MVYELYKRNMHGGKYEPKETETERARKSGPEKKKMKNLTASPIRRKVENQNQRHNARKGGIGAIYKKDNLEL